MLSSCVSLKLTFLSDKFCIVLLIALCTGTNVNMCMEENEMEMYEPRDRKTSIVEK